MISVLTSSLGYGCSQAIHILSQTCFKLQNDSIEDIKWTITLKNRFCWPCEVCQVICRFFSFPSILSQRGWNQINMAWLPRHFQYGSLWVTSLEKKIQDTCSGHLMEAETLTSRKSECLPNIKLTVFVYPLKATSTKRVSFRSDLLHYVMIQIRSTAFSSVLRQ